MSNTEWNDVEANRLPEKVANLKEDEKPPSRSDRKRIVVVGLGMVGIAFMYAQLEFSSYTSRLRTYF